MRDVIPSLVGLNLACIKKDKNGQVDYRTLCFDSRDRKVFEHFYSAVSTALHGDIDSSVQIFENLTDSIIEGYIDFSQKNENQQVQVLDLSNTDD